MTTATYHEARREALKMREKLLTAMAHIQREWPDGQEKTDKIVRLSRLERFIGDDLHDIGRARQRWLVALTMIDPTCSDPGYISTLDQSAIAGAYNSAMNRLWNVLHKAYFAIKGI